MKKLKKNPDWDKQAKISTKIQVLISYFFYFGASIEAEDKKIFDDLKKRYLYLNHTEQKDLINMLYRMRRSCNSTTYNYWIAMMEDAVVFNKSPYYFLNGFCIKKEIPILQKMDII